MSMSTTTTTTTTAPVPLLFGPPLESDLTALGQLLTAAFETSSRVIFGPATPEQVHYRTSLIRQRAILARLSEQGKVSTSHRFLVAKNAKTQAVIGFAIWSLEDDWTEEGIQKRKDEMLLAPSLSPQPPTVNKEAFEDCQKTMAQMQSIYMADRKRCYLKYLCIDAGVQRTGAGTALLRHVRKDAGSRPIFLEAAHTPSAIQFYERLNFENGGTYQAGGISLTVMKLEPTVRSLLDEGPVYRDKDPA